MKKSPIFVRSIIGALVASLGMPQFSIAAPMDLVQYPAGSANKPPVPNVIVSVDNSGSMGTAGINALKTALKDTFNPANLPDGSIRLAYQAMWKCNTIPSDHSDCAKSGVSWNSMRELKGTNNPSEDSHRGQFFRWIDTLSANGNTPTHRMMWNAGEYLKVTGAASPWNAVPGTADAAPQNCRRSYHILMTDGGWNNYPPSGTLSAGDFNFLQNIGIGNADGTAKTFPDGVAYDPTSAETRIYKDSWGGGQTGNKSYGGVDYNFNFPTISDMAFHYWSEDLQPAINNQVTPIIKKSGDETFTAGSSQSIAQYWNPKNNPATWQNMNTYTIGYNNAASWPKEPNSAAYTNPIFNIAQGMYGGDFSAAIVGTKYWRDPIATNETGRQEELWHTAINSRGKFYPAQTSQDLKNAFMDIVGNIVADNTKPITSFASSSSTNTRSDVGEFISGYEAEGWHGYVRSDIIAKSSGARSPNPAWGTKPGYSAPNDRKTTADKLDELATISSRLVLSTNDATNTPISFEWAADASKLSVNQKNMLHGVDLLGEDRLNYIRGDRTKEGGVTAKPFRLRKSRQGDIVNSSIWYVDRPVSNYSLSGYRTFANANKKRLPMLYVGGNDGMLHGFSAVDGQEKIAYIPKGVIPNLRQLTEPGYSHLYYVDGSPFTGDVNWGSVPSNDWRTLLVGALGAGGKGYFILDVTSPGSTDGTLSSNFNVASAANLVVMDKTWHKTEATDPLTAEADIGNIFSAPVIDETNPFKATQIARMNNGKWAVVLGNGYNSANERPVLLIQFVDKATGDLTLKRIPAADHTATPRPDNAIGNGLSAPRLVDINSDGTPDVIYAGDLKGNLWKFDVSAADPDDWKVAFSGQPLYKAVYTSGGSSSKQPITAPPTVKANDRGAGGMMVAFGTGRNLTEEDRTDTTSKHTIYSILDNTRYKLVNDKITIDTAAATPTTVSGLTDLVQQTLDGGAIAGAGDSSGRDFWKMTSNNVIFSGTGAKKGWYFHLPSSGERLLKPMSFYDSSNLLEVISQIPASGGNSAEEICVPAPQEEKQFRTLINIMDGKAPSIQIMDVNGDGYYNKSASQDQGASRMTMDKGAASAVKTVAEKPNAGGGGGTPPPPGPPSCRINITGSTGQIDKLRCMPEQPMRPTWRELR